MISSSWGAPAAFTKGFNHQQHADGLYGRHLHVYSWPGGELWILAVQGSYHWRFLHDPSKDTGFVGCALTSNMVQFFKTQDGSWSHEILPEMPGLITDFLISLDDRFLYFINWLHGGVRRYNIEDPKNSVLTDQVWVGELIQKGSQIVAEGEDSKTLQFDIPEIQGNQLRGGPQMIQLSLDGKRLYFTNSLVSTCDRQFYPDLVEKGSHMLQIDVDTQKGGLKYWLLSFFAECNEEKEQSAESEISRRFLAQKSISYGALNRDRPACNGGAPGQSYSNSGGCLPPPANPPNRGCPKYYRCRSSS
ncbi:hypothetical protein FH972_010561 [Carpinus fangiana]|uniref:Methanethiol oxidase n=1 Tax=Carpinus fangiana TaxID=176857 RepID=A0A660KNN1_9ROSI|nr:hypothetical protein FH972_010561 [Carpinus fangiana]